MEIINAHDYTTIDMDKLGLVINGIEYPSYTVSEIEFEYAPDKDEIYPDKNGNFTIECRALKQEDLNNEI